MALTVLLLQVQVLEAGFLVGVGVGFLVGVAVAVPGFLVGVGVGFLVGVAVVPGLLVGVEVGGLEEEVGVGEAGEEVGVGLKVALDANRLLTSRGGKTKLEAEIGEPGLSGQSTCTVTFLTSLSTTQPLVEAVQVGSISPSALR